MTMTRHALAIAAPTVELSVTATSEELALLSAAAQHRHLSLRDFLRLQIMAAAKTAAKAGYLAATAATHDGPKRLIESGNRAMLRPAFFP
jgi:uncharacterized protein (DUF1778 family)